MRMRITLPRLVTKEVVFLLEFLKPGRISELRLAISVANSGCESVGLLLDFGVGQWLSLSLLVPSPIDKSTFNVWEFAFDTFCWTLAAIIRVQENLLLS